MINPLIKAHQSLNCYNRIKMSSPCLWALLILGTGLAGAQVSYYPRFSGARNMAQMVEDDVADTMNTDLPQIQWAKAADNLFGMTQHYEGSPPINPMRKMKPAPQAPTQWQMMVAPFISLLPDVSDYCHCVGMANCGCCVGVSLKPIPFRNNVCTNVSLTQDDYTGSKHMFRAKVHYDRYKIVDVSVSEREAPKVCLTAPLIPFGGCAQVTNIHFDRKQHKICACLAVSVEYHERSFIQLPVGCICGGRPYGPEEKRGLFGLNLLGVAEKISNKLPIIG